MSKTEVRQELKKLNVKIDKCIIMGKSYKKYQLEHQVLRQLLNN